MMHELTLRGCAPEPLAAYLKALGVFRLVSEQADTNARARWDGDDFVLTSRLDRAMLIAFFLEQYRPTPIITPWNGGSGFFSKDSKAGIDSITGTSDARFDAYNAAIAEAKAILSELRLTEKPDSKEDKQLLLEMLRARLSDDALEWLDAVAVVTDDGAEYPPLLGTGGNDGRLDFGNNHMQRIADMLISPSRNTKNLLAGSLFGGSITGLNAAGTTGQFFPGRAGGANAGPGFDGRVQINAWDYVLMMEGALLFAAAATRRYETIIGGSLSFPFCVRSSAVGYGSAAFKDATDTRSSELWLPLWNASSSLREIRSMFGEGRARLSGRNAVTGSDFARAVARLGVDRGIREFSRHAFLVRNGLSYFAVPIGRWPVEHRKHTELLDRIDAWLVSFRAKARKDAPASITRALTAIDRSILEMCRSDDPVSVQEFLLAVADAETALARSRRFTTEAAITPLQRLGSEWVSNADDQSLEFELAASLASLDLRTKIAPVHTVGNRTEWRFDNSHVDWDALDLIDGCIALLDLALRPCRRDDEAQRNQQRAQRNLWKTASLAAIEAFIDGRLDDARIRALVRALSLCHVDALPDAEPSVGIQPPVLFAMLGFGIRPAAMHLDAVLPRGMTDEKRERALAPRNATTILRRAASGDAVAASSAVTRTLRAIGLPSFVDEIYEPEIRTRRCAAAVLFPIARGEAIRLAESIVKTGSTLRSTTTMEVSA